MKKFSLILAFLMAVCLFSISVFAADAVASVSDVSAKAGEEVTLTVTITNSPGIAGAQLYIGYDSDVMSYVSAKGMSNSFYFAGSEEADANPVKLVIANLGLANIQGDINVAEIVFKINDNANAGKYDVSISALEAYDGDIQPVAVSVDNAVVTITSTSTGSAHAHNYKKTVVEPAGAEAGYTLYECSCGHSYKGNYVYTETSEVTAPKFTKQRDYANNFQDVTSDKWFEKYVRIAYEYKLANGTSATKFSPDNKFTVAQALTAAVNIHTTYNGTTVRAAATGEAWYVPYVEYCIEKGIITEGQFTNFDANITRGDMAVVFANVLPDSEYNAVREGAPADVIEESAVYLSVKKLYQAGIVGGDAGTGNYRPDDEIVRSEACVIFTRIAVTDERAK